MTRRASSAVSLAEVMLALSLLAIAALGLLATFFSGTRMMEQSKDVAMATDVGREFLENIKAQGYDKTAVGTFDGTNPDLPDTTTGFPPHPYPNTRRNGEVYTLTVECTQQAPTTRMLRVTIAWEGRHRTELATMLHR